MKRVVELDMSVGGTIDFPKRVKICNVQGVISPGNSWKFKTPDISEKFVDASGNTYWMYLNVIDNTNGGTSLYVNYEFENWKFIE